jgi:PAS domain S-box-containing protein
VVYEEIRMLPETLQDRASLYVAGALTPEERDSFEVLLEYHAELRAYLAQCQEVGAAVALALAPPAAAPPSALKARILGSLDRVPARLEPEALVVTDPLGRVEWVNSAFTSLCGYSLEELRGRKPGHVLQGPDTDPATVARIREALQARRACRETLVNYHKDGTRYRAEVRIAPVLGDAGEPLWFVARERRLPEAAP